MNPDYGLGKKLAEEIEDYIYRLCENVGLSPKTPPDDIAGWVVKELKKGGAKRGP